MDDYAGPGVPDFGVMPPPLNCGRHFRKERHPQHTFTIQMTDDSPERGTFLCPGYIPPTKETAV